MENTVMTTRVKVITALEIIIFPISFILRIISANKTWNGLMRGLNDYGFDGINGIGTDSNYLAYMFTMVSFSFLFLPCFIVAIINIRNKKSNGNILIIVACIIYSLYNIMVIIRQNSMYEIIVLIYFMVLLFLIVINMKDEAKNKDQTLHGNSQQPQYYTLNCNSNNYCSNCGSAVKPNEKYCRNCGSLQNSNNHLG